MIVREENYVRLCASNKLLRRRVKFLQAKINLLEEALYQHRKVKFTYSRLKVRGVQHGSGKGTRKGTKAKSRTQR